MFFTDVDQNARVQDIIERNYGEKKKSRNPVDFSRKTTVINRVTFTNKE